jgi:predicted nucleotidyltransferase component of viral defense system
MSGDEELPPSASEVGPTFVPEELAGRKLVALFDRTEARDFADVFVLAHDTELLLRRDAEIDPGFDPVILASMIETVDRFTDEEIPGESDAVKDLRVPSSLARPPSRILDPHVASRTQTLPGA